MLAGPLMFSLLVVLTAWSGDTPLHAQVVDPSPVRSALNPAAMRSSSDAQSWHAREGQYYQRNWGIDVVDVRQEASGQMVVFRYMILNPEKAKPFNDAKNIAYLLDEKSGTHLNIPQMEKVGSLRTTVSPKPGRMYWMVFANTGKIVHPGSLVDVVIGDVHVNGLTVLDR